ncbi:hypothetical protein OAP56_01745 [Rickettsiaceae bacterium]|nr:hypothetical protein [Rickettsiaceae bacterium]
MSIYEALVVIVIGLLVLKPEDVPQIVAKFKELRLLFSQTKDDILSSVQSIPEFKEWVHENDLEEDADQMNIYLEKIADLGFVYEGEYSLVAIRSHYRRVVQSKLDQRKLDQGKKA